MAWLERHRLFGPLIRDWHRSGRVSRRAEWSAAIPMALCAAPLPCLSPSHGGALAGIGAMACALAWPWHRPEP